MSNRPRAASALRAALCATTLCSVACGRPQAAPHPSALAAAGGVAAGPAPVSRIATTTTTPAVTPGDAPTSLLAPVAVSSAITPPALAPLGANNCLPSHDGYLRVRMRGDSSMDIDWHDADMQCDGGPRPGQQGLRLTFAGPGRRGEHSLRFVFGIAAAPGVRAARNVPTNVTVIFEGENKLYSTAGDGKCTMDEFRQRPLRAPGHAHVMRISARGFCTAPATAIAGQSGLLLTRFDFAGAVVDQGLVDAPNSAKP